jgi:nicotinate-nucleotide adenylyltransferase
MTAHRVGIMGGTFDPVHLGHLIAARAVVEALDLEFLLLSPVSQPWHKSADHLAPAADRLAMLYLAIEDDPALRVTTVDLDRGGDTYSIDTVRDLTSPGALGLPVEDLELFFIAGADAIAGLARWKSPEELLRSVHVVAMRRPGFAFECPGVVGAETIVEIDIDALDISSTTVRARAANGESLDDLVSPAVGAYIREHGLYGSSRR